MQNAQHQRLERLDTIGAVLKRLLGSPDVDDLELRSEVQSIYDEGDALWKGG
jgi:hypothetical protein